MASSVPIMASFFYGFYIVCLIPDPIGYTRYFPNVKCFQLPAPFIFIDLLWLDYNVH